MFAQSITPAFRQHMEAQLSFLTEMSRKMFEAEQNVIKLHLELAQDLVKEIGQTRDQLMQITSPGQFASVAANQLHPATEKLNAYQQCLSNLIVGVNIDLTKTAESHLPEASRAVAALAGEIGRNVTEKAAQASQQQRALLNNLGTMAQPARDLAGASQSEQAQPA